MDVEGGGMLDFVFRPFSADVKSKLFTFEFFYVNCRVFQFLVSDFLFKKQVFSV